MSSLDAFLDQRFPRSMAGALRRPAQRCYLYLHPAPAGRAVARRLHRQALAAAVVDVRRRPVAAVVRLAAVPAEVSRG
ncbi:hypothetical protein [Arthrobacter sp. B2I5]|uniref:hypothetical protein n=1 Tax=Arthrobacter sp. B2I5 TaxID=3042266 RepID=UPI0027D7EC94|nr:hypothetical protein [Arthrobacter sp. B2I5]